MSATVPATRGLWKDPFFLAALAAGPLCWLVIYSLLQPEPRWNWPLTAPVQYLLGALIYPVVEEIVFRGLLQEVVRERISGSSFGPLSIANLLTSLCFTALHFIYHPPLWAALVLFPSLVFGFFKDRTGQLTAPIVLHVFYNAGFLWLFTKG